MLVWMGLVTVMAGIEVHGGWFGRCVLDCMVWFTGDRKCSAEKRHNTQTYWMDTYTNTTGIRHMHRHTYIYMHALYLSDHRGLVFPFVVPLWTHVGGHPYNYLAVIDARSL